jgi:hypothetical protein
MEGIKKRLRLVVTILELTNAEIVKKADYSPNSVSDFLKKDGKEPSAKFIRSFCNVFKEANYDFIMTGNGNPTIGMDLSSYGFKQANEEVTLLKKEMEFMAQAINELKGQLIFYKQLISTAYKINPELEGKLLSLLSLHGQSGELTIPVLTIGDYTRDLAAA